MVRRTESPSSINTYKQCPRKYYYQYILKLPTTKSIHLTRGNIVHSALEDFFSVPIENLNSDDYKESLKLFASALLLKHWRLKQDELNTLGLTDAELNFYFKESDEMVKNFAAEIVDSIDQNNFVEGFKKRVPIREKEFRSEKHQVRGFIDAIETHKGVRLMDYKTSNKAEITDSYELQLNIYALLYYEKHGELPTELGIYFLKFGEQTVPCTMENVKQAEFECEQIHASTESDEINDYEKHTSGLCKWRTGQCDFYDRCCRED